MSDGALCILKIKCVFVCLSPLILFCHFVSIFLWFGLVWLIDCVVLLFVVVVGWFVLCFLSTEKLMLCFWLVGSLVIVGFCWFWFGVCVVLFCVTSDCLQSLVNTLCCLMKRHTVLGSRI